MCHLQNQKKLHHSILQFYKLLPLVLKVNFCKFFTHSVPGSRSWKIPNDARCSTQRHRTPHWPTVLPCHATQEARIPSDISSRSLVGTEVVDGSECWRKLSRCPQGRMSNEAVCVVLFRHKNVRVGHYEDFSVGCSDAVVRTDSQRYRGWNHVLTHCIMGKFIHCMLL